MALEVAKVDTWFATVEDRPGAVAEKLAALSEAGANLTFVIGRRTNKEPGRGFVWLTGLRGAKQFRAAEKAGFSRTSDLCALRVEGGDRPGLVAQVTRALAEHGLNLRGLSAASTGRRAVVHLAFDCSEDTGKAVRVLRQLK